MVARLLRERTLLTHKRVESQLALLDGGLSADRLAEVIQRFYGFWGATEPVIDEWAAAHPAAAAAVRWDRRRRARLFAADLVVLGMPSEEHAGVPRPSPVFGQFGQAAVFGWLYVTEGSTLGGAIIDRHVRNLTGPAGSGLGCFTPYGEGPGPMWKSYKSALEDFASDDVGRTGAVIDAAVATFEALERWLAPVDVGSAA